MSLQQTIDQEIKKSMLAKDSERLGTLRMLKSAIGYALIEAKKDAMSDAEVIPLLQKEVKKRREAADLFEKGGRPELAEKEISEIALLETFLPEPLSAEELEGLVKSAIQDTGAASKKDMGKVIKAVQEKAAGRADGKTISGLVGKLLN